MTLVIEYLRSDNNDLDITFTAASGITSVVFEIYDLDTNEFVQAGTAASGASQVFTANLTEDSVAYDRNVKIEWVSSTASGASTTINYASIIRPYVTATRIRALADISSTITDSTLEKYEKRARNFINATTGMSFYKEKDTVVVYGNNSDVLTLRDPIIRIDYIYEDDILMYDAVSTASFNKFDYDLEPSVSKRRIKAVGGENSASAKTITDDRHIMEFPDMVVIPYDGIFKKDYAYKIVGVFGYNYIPSNIELATALIVEDYLCNDWSVRNKNVESMKTDSYEYKYASGFAGGSGNLLVDKLLSEYTSQITMLAI